MTKPEAIAYAQQLLKDSGASDEEVTQAAKLFDREKFAQGFIARPDVDRALTSEKQRYADFERENTYLKTEWLPQAKSAYEKNLKGIAMLEKYQELYGPIQDDSNPQDIRRAAAATGLTEAKVRELMQSEFEQRPSARDQATLDLMEIREDYMDRFKKRLPLKDFEKAVSEARKSGNNDSLSAIYKDWIEPEVSKLTPHRFSEDELKARDKRLQEEAIKDFASRNKIPVSAQPSEPHILFERVAADRKKANGDAGQSGREAFLEVLNDPDPTTVKQRYPV